MLSAPISHSSLAYTWPDQLPDGNICWFVKPSQSIAAVLGDLISLEERAKADKFFHLEDARAYVAAHGLKRGLLSHFSGVAPKDLRFQLGPRGKPTLEASTLSFSISHSRGWVAAAIGRNCEVGVDVETARTLDCSLLADRVLSDVELLECAHSTCFNDVFLRFWVLKEAVSKACGVGLATDFRKLGRIEHQDGWEIFAPEGRRAYAVAKTFQNARAALAVMDRSPRAVTFEGPMENGQ